MITLSRSGRRRWAGLGLATVTALALTAAACGDDDEAGSSDTTAFCDARIELEQQFTTEGEPDVERITALVDQLQASASGDLATNVDGLATALASAAESGSDPIEDPAFGENIGPIDDFALTECGHPTVDVTGVDYAFDGLPESVSAGVTGFRFTNEGAEPHEMVLFRLDDSLTEPVVDLFASDDEGLEESMSLAGATFAESGQSSALFADLAPGRYAAVCFIPVGGGDDGPPHFTEGMIAEFEVS